MRNLPRRVFFSLVPIAALAALLAATQGRRATDNWTVVVSKPLTLLGQKAGELYSEHEYLTAMMNQLAADGLSPAFTQTLPHFDNRGLADDRVVVFCQKK